jgi:hypothetical protein
MTKAEFEKKREDIYREILKKLNTVSNHPVVQLQVGPKDACVEIVSLYKQYNSLVDGYLEQQNPMI